MTPVFIFVTRSFWLLVATLGMIVADQEAMVLLTELLPPDIASLVVKYAPLVTLLAMFQQRSGSARPYSLNWRDK